MKLLTQFLSGLGVCVTTMLLAASAWAQQPMNVPALELDDTAAVSAVVPLTGGGYIVGGDFRKVFNSARGRIAKLTASGALDATFAPSLSGGSPDSMVVIGSSVYVAGSFTQVNGQPRAYLVKLSLTTGAVDAAFNPAPNGPVLALAADATGNLYAAGAFTAIGGTSGRNLVKLNAATGVATAAWNPVFSVPFTGNNYSLAINGTWLYVSGSTDCTTTPVSGKLVRVNLSTGAVDGLWVPPMDAGQVGGLAMAFDATGNLFVTGSSRYAGAFCDVPPYNLLPPVLAKLSVTNGAPVSGFTAPAGVILSGPMVANAGGLFLQDSDPATNESLTASARIRKLDLTSGATLWTSPVELTEGATRLAPITGGLFVAGTGFLGSSGSFGAVTLDPANGQLQVGFNTRLLRSGWGLRTATGADGKYYMGGRFRFVNGQPRKNLLRLNADRTLDLSWTSGVNGPVYSLHQTGTSLYVGGYFNQAEDVPRNGAAKFITTNDTVDPLWNPDIGGGPRVILSDASGVYIGGLFESVGGNTAHRYLVKVNHSTGAVDPTFAPQFNPDYNAVFVWYVRGMALSGGNLYVGTTMNMMQVGANYRSLAKLNSTTGLADAAWDPNPSGTAVRAVTVDAGNVYVTGGFATIGGQSRIGLAKISASTGVVDPAWVPTGLNNNSAFAVAVTNGFVYTGGVIGGVNNAFRRYALVGGAVDPDFAPVITTDSELGQIAYGLTRLLEGNGVIGAHGGTNVSGVASEGFSAFADQSLSVETGLATLESVGSIGVTVQRSGGTGGTVTVQYATANGTALAGSDYTARSGTLTFAPGVTSQVINVPITSDSAAEGSELFTLSLSNPTGAALGANATINITILDDETGVGFQTANPNLIECNCTHSVAVNRFGSSSGSVSVNYSLAAGTAQLGVDFLAGSGTLIWPDGDLTTKYIPVTLLGNSIVQPNRNLTINLSGLSSGSLAGPANAVVTIVDDDNAVQFSSASYVGTEGTTVTVSVTRTGSTGAPASVNYATLDGSAIAGVDYVLASGALNWAAGDASAKSFTVTLLGDAGVSATKSFQVQLTSPGGTVLGSPAVATISRTDAASALIAFDPATYVISETSPSVTLSVKRTGPTTAASSVQYTTVNGTAQAGSDYVAKSGTLTWTAGDTTPKTILVAITNDLLVEGDEAFSVVLSSPTGALVGAAGTATVTILDNDIAAGSQVSFNQLKYVVNEGVGANVTLNVVRSIVSGGNLANTVTVNYATAAGTATAADFATKSGTLTFGPGETSKEVTVAILNDAIAEGPETFKVNLTVPSPGLLLGPGSSATVVILDADELFPPQGKFQPPPAGWSMNYDVSLAGWHVTQGTTAAEGQYVLESDTIFDFDAAVVEYSANFTQPGNVSFKLKISSEPGFDRLAFYIDGVKQGEWSGAMAAVWTTATYAMGAGNHTLKWEYKKDGTYSLGADRAWIDAVTLPANTQ